MNKFIQNTKLFFSKKPVRIVTALIIIAAIMTGVAFGVIALVNAFSDPCAKQPGTTWDKDLKVCVKDSCQMDNGEDGIVCKAKGKVNQCIAKDYCDYSGIEGQYSYDEESCMCKLDCSSLGEEYQGFTKDGTNAVNMNKTTSGWEPNNKLYCGSRCEFSHKNIYNPGGEGWCPPLYLCGKEITESGDVIDPGVNCFYNKKYGRCGDSDIICPRPNQNSPPECTSTKEGPRCIEKLCGVSETNDSSDLSRVPCITNYDCSSDGKSSNFECDHSSKELESKYFQKVGICKTTDISSTDSKRCINNYNAIGEDHYGNAIDCNDRTGISNLIKQCPGAMDNGDIKILYDNSITKYDNAGLACVENQNLCSTPENKWQANPSNNPTDMSLCQSTPETCTIGEECSLPEYECCPNHIGKNCCHAELDKNPNCLLTTTLPYDASFLALGSLGEQLSNPEDVTILENYNKKFRKSLGRKVTDSNFQLIDGKHIKDGLKGKLYGQCGSKISGQEPNPEFVPIVPINKKSLNTNICSSKSKCQDATELPSDDGKIGPIPICLSDISRKPYWSNKDTQEANRTSFQVKFTGPNCQNPTNNINNYLIDKSGVDSWSFVSGQEGDYSRINFGVDCNELNVTLSNSSPKWNELQNGNIWNSGNLSDFTKKGNKYISTTPDGGIDPQSKLGIFKVQKCPSNWEKTFDCANNPDDGRCLDCNKTKHNGDSYYCPGNLNNFPIKMVRSPRRIGNPTYPFDCFGIGETNNLVSHDGKYCKIGFNGNCKK